MKRVCAPFTAQISIALENAKLFEDVQNTKNYNESVLESMSNGVITVDEHHQIITCNSAGRRILQVREEDIIGQSADDFFGGVNDWVLDSVRAVDETHEIEIVMDKEIEFDGDKVSVNLPHSRCVGRARRVWVQCCCWKISAVRSALSRPCPGTWTRLSPTN